MAKEPQSRNVGAGHESKPDVDKEAWLTTFRQFEDLAIPYMLEQLVRPALSTNAHFYSHERFYQSPMKLDPASSVFQTVSKGVILLENPDVDWVVALASRFRVPENFWKRHIGKFLSDPFSTAIRKRSKDIHLDVHIHEGDPWKMASSELFGKTIKHGFRVSCHRLDKDLYVAVISAVSDRTIPNSDVIDARFSTLGTPAVQGAGIPVRSSFVTSPQGVLEGLLGSFFSELGTNAMVFMDAEKFDDPSRIIQWLLIVHAWKWNLDIIGADIRRRAYRATNSPNVHSFNRLTDYRRNIAGLRNEMAGYQRQRFAALIDYDSAIMIKKLDHIPDDSPLLFLRTSDHLIQDIEKQLSELGTTLNEVNQFLIGCINLSDSQFMKTQAERATTLTILAAIYLPLTLVTGMFGMNVKEINGGSVAWWVCLVALLVVIAATSVGFGVWTLLKRRQLDEYKAQGKWESIV